jgi:hypothetical protein
LQSTAWLSSNRRYKNNPIESTISIVQCVWAIAGACDLYDAVLIRRICRELSVEKDFSKLQELSCLLQSLIAEDEGEMRVRVLELAARYPFLRDALK